MKKFWGYNFYPVILELGKFYTIKYNGLYSKKHTVVQFIKPTKKGFNFLNLNTHKCILKHHIYPCKKSNINNLFFLSEYIQIIK